MVTQNASSHSGRRRSLKLPLRVLRAVHEQQNAGERLVGWFQLAVVILFGLLYTAAPKTFASEHTFEPVPWVLAAYLILTVLRLVFSYRRTLPVPLLYTSVIVDVALLLVMIWTFHLQYAQPPTFYLKSPSLLYVFIFIALRALRFEARYVIAAGLVAAAGWIALTLYAVYSGGGLDAITRDYVAYLTSNRILIGAELDKVLTILTVTAILAVAITRARHLLIRAVADKAAVRDLSKFFSPEIAERIRAAEKQFHAGQGVVREAAILNTDIRGFTQIAARVAPDELMKILAEYQARLVPIIQRHGGVIDKFLGDGIMATFGAVQPLEDYAAAALRAVEDIMTETAKWPAECQQQGRPTLSIGAAVATGKIVVGAVGAESRLEYTVIGDAVNLSAKLEKHTKMEKVRALCTMGAYRRASEQGYRRTGSTGHLHHRRIMGVSDPMDIVILAK